MKCMYVYVYVCVLAKKIILCSIYLVFMYVCMYVWYCVEQVRLH